MNKEILVIKHITREGPGLLADELDARGIGSRTVDLSLGESLPSGSVKRWAAVAAFGGPDSANDEHEARARELGFIAEVITAGVPYLGVCLGMQTLVKAAGGAVFPCPEPEIGFRAPDGTGYSVELTEEGRIDPLFRGLGTSFRVFHLHGETVEPAPGTVLLGTGSGCRNQIVRAGGSAYGIQSHFELTPAMFETWLCEDADLSRRPADELRADFAAVSESYRRTGRILFRNFLAIAGF